jgi:ketosteroid isomerase-like protein
MYGTARLVSLFTVAVAVGCASVPKVNRVTEEAAIRTQDQRFLQAITAKDAGTIASIYAPDAYLMTPNAPAVTGGMLGMPSLQFTFTPTRIDISKAGDMAMDVGTYRFAADGPQGRIEDSGNYTSVWKKLDGQWRLASDIATSERPMPVMPVAAVVVMDVDQPQIQASAGLQWSDLQVPGFASGVKMAVLHGDPSKKGDYTMRLRFPDNYMVPPHWHPEGEHVTVLQGSFSLGMGSTFDRTALRTYGPGDFLYAPAKMPHFAMTKGETVVQLHGEGPFAITLVKP